MEKIIDLTGFGVDASDYAETFANFSKWFEEEDDAIMFLHETMDYIRELVASGEAKFFCCDSFHGPTGYLPMVRCKHLDCQEYNEDGDFEGEDEDDLSVVDAYSCIKDISLSYCAEGGMIAKVQLILTYFSDKDIGSYEPKTTKITTYGEFGNF